MTKKKQKVKNLIRILVKVKEIVIIFIEKFLFVVINKGKEIKY